EPALYDEFSKSIFPLLLSREKPSDTIRIWVPACSSGEEVYSIAICLFEYLSEQHSIVTSIQLFATDLSEGAIEKARAGIYSQSSVARISPSRLARFFIKIEDQYQIIKPIRDICVFATHNLLRDPPFSKLDLISCQNVLIYLEAESQKKILQSFHYALKPSGYLLLGKSESIGKASELFQPASKDFKLFTKKEMENPHYDFFTPGPLRANLTAPDQEKTGAEQLPEIDIDREAEKILLRRYVPASVTINKDLQVLQFYGSTMNYLHPAAGKASLHLLKMVREELILDVRTLLHRAKQERLAIKKDGIPLSGENDGREVSIEVIPLRPLRPDTHYLILFSETGSTTGNVSRPPEPADPAEKRKSKDHRLRLLEQEVSFSREQLRLISEEAEANREELQSANEEILSSNEELQSINEELETSKEELQSSNEELNTINEELLSRNNELKDAIEYSDAIIQTMNEPLVVLSSDLRIRTANKAFYTVFRVRPAETEGHYFYETSNAQWNIRELRDRLDDIIHADTSFDHFELPVNFPAVGEKVLLFNALRMGPENSRNRRYLLVIQDITQQKNTLKELNYSKEHFRLLVQNSSDIITILSADGTIKYQSESLERVLGYLPAERIGKNVFSNPIVHPADVEKKRDFLKRCIASPGQPVSAEFRLRHKDGSYKEIDAVCINLLDNPFLNGLVATYRDITRQKMLERQKEEFIAIASHELKTPVTSIRGYTQIIQRRLPDIHDPEIAGLVTKLNNQVNRLSGLLENLLDVTRITGGQLDLLLSSFDINTLLQRIVEEFKLTTRMKIETALQPCPPVSADMERIGQVCINLLSNAIKYSPEADKVIVRSFFEIGSSLPGPAVTVTVRDFGFGIKDEDQDAIFERFYRTKDSKTKHIAGLGMGLYISSEIIKRHNGKIWVQSKTGEGSTFGFTIPVANK
ncbi:MAG TPA: CheR family methyltransferase, partial [Puia sp.]|nr:CheR family methyltransferase [Puia sp.]